MAVPVIDIGVGENFSVASIPSGSGIGYYGNGFGTSIRVSEYAQTVFITDSTGTVEGARGDCAIPTGTGTATIAGVSYNLRNIPNYLCTFRIRVTADSPINTQNAVFQVYDGTTLGVAPVGATFKAAELIHPSTTADATGTGSLSWVTLDGSDVTLPLVDNPGSNSATVGTSTQSTVHEWFVIMAFSPDSVGPKSGKGHFECEYL